MPGVDFYHLNHHTQLVCQITIKDEFLDGVANRSRTQHSYLHPADLVRFGHGIIELAEPLTQGLAYGPYGLTGAVLVFDEGKTDKVVPILPEAQARRDRDFSLLQ